MKNEPLDLILKGKNESEMNLDTKNEPLSLIALQSLIQRKMPFQIRR